VPIDYYAALKLELLNDPAGIGYSSAVDSGDDQALANALNLTRAGAAYSIYKNNIPVKDIIANIASADYASLTALQIAKLQLLFAGNNQFVDATDLNTRNIFVGIFSGMSTTVANLGNLAKRQGSRAEVLYGYNTSVTTLDVARALRGQ
jgi:hypothetical protein